MNTKMLDYQFSRRGASHKATNLPCQDCSAILELGDGWRFGVVADGVGACKHADQAAALAVEISTKVVAAAFSSGGSEDDFSALLRVAGNSAQNAIERYVCKQGEDLNEFHTTLTTALYNGAALYYAHVGDSGILALDQTGAYHVITSKMNNEFGEVDPLASRTFEVGKVSFDVAAVLLMTDGLLDWLAPSTLADYPFHVHVPRAGLFLDPLFWQQDAGFDEEKMCTHQETLLKSLDSLVDLCVSDTSMLYPSLHEGNLKDDLTAAVLVNTAANVTCIAWQEPPSPTVEQTYLQELLKLLQLYPSCAKQQMEELICANNPDWDEAQVQHFFGCLLALAEKQGEEATNTSLPQAAKEEQLNTADAKPQVEESASAARVQKRRSFVKSLKGVWEKGLWDSFEEWYYAE